MSRPDRSAYARANAGWLIPAFGAVLLLGILGGSLFAVAAGVAGLGWVVLAVRSGR